MRKQTAGKGRKFAAVITAMLCIALFVVFFLRSEGMLFTFSTQEKGEDFVKVIDVGQGDSTLISSNGYNCLIDTGSIESVNELSSSLFNSGIKKIDVLFLTHLHADHTGGVAHIFEHFTVNNVILPELSTHSEGIYSAELAINKVTTSGGGVYSAVQGMNFELGDFEITVLGSYGKMKDENNRSLVIMAKIDDKKFLFTGDAEQEVEKALIDEGINLNCDVLKVGHHGSNTSTSVEFLNKTTPEFAAISVGKGNIYGHPNKALIKRLEERKVKFFRTDFEGDITFRIEKGKILAATEIM